MFTRTTHTTRTQRYHYYRCNREAAYGPDACSQKSIRVEKIEPLVWGFVSGLLKDPERLRAGLDEMIEREREGPHADPERERKEWAQRIADTERKRGAYQDQQAAGLMTLDELREKLGALDEVRETARRELAALDDRRERLEELERDRDALIERYAAMVPEALGGLTGEERNTLYRMLRLQVVPTSEGLALSGVFCDPEPTPRGKGPAGPRLGSSDGATQTRSTTGVSRSAPNPDCGCMIPGVRPRAACDVLRYVTLRAAGDHLGEDGRWRECRRGEERSAWRPWWWASWCSPLGSSCSCTS
jgi:hypothetical protein